MYHQEVFNAFSGSVGALLENDPWWLWDDLFIMVPFYVVAVRVLGMIYQKPSVNRESWKQVMFSYNLTMSIYSLFTAIGMTYFLTMVYPDPLFENNCADMRGFPLFDRLVRWFYYSKYVEFLDTLFLIVNGKRVSWLHYVHHIGVTLNQSYTYRSHHLAAWLPVLFNSTIHALMYFYYAMTIRKIRIPGKSLLTSLQILQLSLGLSILWIYVDMPCVRERETHMVALLYSYAYVIVLILFFIDFFVRNYILKQPEMVETKKPKTS